MTQNAYNPEDNDYEEDFTEFPEEEEDEIPVKRAPALRHSQTVSKKILSTQNGHLPKADLALTDIIQGSTLSSTTARKPMRTGLKNGNSTGVFVRDGMRKTASSAMNRSFRLPQIRPNRNESSSGMSRRTTDHVSERVLSARANRVHELENERNLLRVNVQDLKREVQTLNQLLRRQGRALGQYEGTDDKLPTLLRQSEEDGRVTREQLRLSRQKNAQLREQYRQLEIYSQNLEKERDKLLALANDKELQDKKILKNERDDFFQQLEDEKHRGKELERRISSLQKAQVRERQFSDNRLKEKISQNEKLEAENTTLKQQMKSNIFYKEKSATRKNLSGKFAIGKSPSPSRDKVSRAPSQDKASRVTKEEEERVLKNAKNSFLEEFKIVTEISPLFPKQNEEKVEKVEKVEQESKIRPISVAEASKKPANAWKSRTSPDLLRDHEERIVFADLPSTSSSLASSSSMSVFDKEQKLHLQPESSVSEGNRKMEWKRKPSLDDVDISEPKNFNENFPKVFPPKTESVLKNELLEKIRLLDVSRKEQTAKNLEGSGKVAAGNSFFSSFSPLEKSNESFFSKESSSHTANGIGDAQPRETLQTTFIPKTEYFSDSGNSGRLVKTVHSDDEIEEIEFF